jgi:Bacterial sugar transferase
VSKRAFDLIAALLGLVLLSPLLLLVALLIRLDSPGPVFFRQERIGKGFRPFRIYKFCTMAPDTPRQGGPITFGDDPRITRLGRVLRRPKIDEFPQLLNVLRGEMSFVGPRPEVRPYREPALRAVSSEIPRGLYAKAWDRLHCRLEGREGRFQTSVLPVLRHAIDAASAADASVRPEDPQVRGRRNRAACVFIRTDVVG